MRTHFCGLVDEALIGQTVTLCGWADVARNLGGLCFIDLRDHEGIVQVVAEPSEHSGNAEVIAAAAQVGYEDCLRVTGVVRSATAVNDKIRTGQVEVVATQIELLNKAEPLPFHAHENPGEDIRLKYRYLDLRTPGDAAHDAHPHQAGAGAAPLARRARFPGHRDADPDQGHARRRARLPGAGAHASGRVLRAAAVAAAVQADPDDGRLRPLLPDRALLPRRGPARRPPARVHPARHGVRVGRPSATCRTPIEEHDPRRVPRSDGRRTGRPSSRA